MKEIQDLHDRGFKEITLLGQNVDSYLWYGGGLKKDFVNASEMQKATSVDFDQLLEMVAVGFPKMRIRFSTSNPQDMARKRVARDCQTRQHLQTHSFAGTIGQRQNSTRHQSFAYQGRIHDFGGQNQDHHPKLFDYTRYDFRLSDRNRTRPPRHLEFDGTREI